MCEASYTLFLSLSFQAKNDEAKEKTLVGLLFLTFDARH